MFKINLDLIYEHIIFFPLILTLLCYWVLRYFPKILHKPKNLGSLRAKVSKISHRGSRFEGIVENTIASFKDAINAGTDVIEFDVWLSKDKKVVVFHDSNFSRMTKNKNNLSPYSTNYTDYPALSDSIQDQNDRLGLLPNKEWSKIPLFQDVLDIIPNHVCFIIEFKQDSDELISEVHRILNSKGKTGNTFWFSLKESINKKLRSADKKIPTICSEIGMLKVLISHYIGILPFISIDDAVFGVTTEEVDF